MIEYILLVIFILFIAYAIISFLALGIIKKRICSVCAAVSTTWIVLLLLSYLGYFSDKLIIGILMGESVTGLMYFVAKKYEKFEWLSLLKIAMILVGTGVVYIVISRI